MNRAARNHRCGVGAEACGVGAECAGATECGADLRGPAPRPIGVAPGLDRTPGDIVEMLEPTELCTRGSAKPFCFTCWETLDRLRTLPRGIPNPAESLRTIIRFGLPRPGKGPRFTITVCPAKQVDAVPQTAAEGLPRAEAVAIPSSIRVATPIHTQAGTTRNRSGTASNPMDSQRPTCSRIPDTTSRRHS